MARLSENEKREILDEAALIRRTRESALREQQERIRRYYRQIAQTSTREEWEALRRELRWVKDGKLAPLKESSKDKALRLLADGRVPSEAVFMSFFHVACPQLRRHGGQAPKPSELLEMKKIIFGHRWVTTCTHSIALLGYTLGLLNAEKNGEGDKAETIEEFEAERARKMQEEDAFAEGDEFYGVDAAAKTTELFEEYLDGSYGSDLNKFKQLFNRRAKLLDDRDRRENLRKYMERIFHEHKWGSSLEKSGYYLEAHGCLHMESTLRKRVINRQGTALPQRDWILMFSLCMGLREEEANRLLHCCGYVDIGFAPWEAGFRRLLRNPDMDRTESLDSRENMYAFLSANGLEPPSALFASFPHLVTRPNKKDRALFAALLLDCCADVQALPDNRYQADFDAAGNIPSGESGIPEFMEIPDFCDIFFPPQGCATFSDQLRSILSYGKNVDLPDLDRASADFQAASETIQKWSRNWKPVQGTDVGRSLMQNYPEICVGSAACRHKLLYALLLYTLYTGHLPLEYGRQPALTWHGNGFGSVGHSLIFDGADESRVCQNMAAEVLGTLCSR